MLQSMPSSPLVPHQIAHHPRHPIVFIWMYSLYIISHIQYQYNDMHVIVNTLLSMWQYPIRTISPEKQVYVTEIKIFASS